MTAFSKEITKEILEGIGLELVNIDNLSFNGLPIAHGLKFPIDEIAAGIHGAYGSLISYIWKLRTGEDQDISIDVFHAYLSLSSVLFLKQNGYVLFAPDPKYPTIGLYECKDKRKIYLHGGHPSLRDKILRILQSPNEQDYIAEAVKEWNAQDLEDTICKAGGTAAVVRTAEEWTLHLQGQELMKKPMIDIKLLKDNAPETFSSSPQRPLSGLLVLDLTHVLAAPMASRVLAEYGADVLHITAPQVADIQNFIVDTSHGKRQAYLNLKDPRDLNKFKELLADADVLVEGWKPKMMDNLGLSPEAVQEIRPGIVHMSLSCYGNSGPFADRGGWEQLGQASCGIIESNSHPTFDQSGNMTGRVSLDTIQTHGLAICDYVSGFLGATGILAALIKRHHTGGGYFIDLALTRSGMWALSKPAMDHEDRRSLSLPLDRPEYEAYLGQLKGPYGILEFLAPVPKLSKTPPMFSLPTSPIGSGDPSW